MRPRRPIWQASLLVGYGLVAAAFVVRMALSDLPWWMSLPGAVALAGVAALPPTLAWLAGRRPGLFAGAGILALVLSVGLSILSPVMILLGAIWLVMLALRLPHRPVRTIAATLLATIFGVVAFACLFLHLDPRCTNTYVGGTARVVPSDMPAGWIWEVPDVQTSSMSGGPGVASSVCISDVVTWMEAIVILATAGSGVMVGWVTAGEPRVIDRPAQPAPVG